LWVPAFFGLHSLRLGLVVLAAMLVLTALTIRSFRRVNRAAAWLLVPYACWTLYATYLNAGFWLLNHS
jgi:tryptophan-rich sensory protein